MCYRAAKKPATVLLRRKSSSEKELAEWESLLPRSDMPRALSPRHGAPSSVWKPPALAEPESSVRHSAEAGSFASARAFGSLKSMVEALPRQFDDTEGSVGSAESQGRQHAWPRSLAVRGSPPVISFLDLSESESSSGHSPPSWSFPHVDSPEPTEPMTVASAGGSGERQAGSPSIQTVQASPSYGTSSEAEEMWSQESTRPPVAPDVKLPADVIGFGQGILCDKRSLIHGETKRTTSRAGLGDRLRPVCLLFNFCYLARSM